MDYEMYMKKAYNLASKAYKKNEVPIGAVLVMDKKIIGFGYNLRNYSKNVLYHAEIIAINMACKKTGDWRLENSTLFVTVEPCPMCAGAILQARIKEVVFAIYNKKFGACGSNINILGNKNFNHQVEITSGILSEKCYKLMKNFFKTKR